MLKRERQDPGSKEQYNGDFLKIFFLSFQSHVTKIADAEADNSETCSAGGEKASTKCVLSS